MPLPENTTALTNVPSPALGRPVTGDRLLIPNDDDKRRIDRAGLSRVLGALHYCVDTNGRVNRVALVRPTGLPNYDRVLINGVHSWVFKPYLDEGQPVAVCSTAMFIYSQGSRERQPGQFQFGRKGAR